MIARIWHGRTKAEHLNLYSEFLQQRAVPDYGQTQGFKGLVFLRQVKGEEAHFKLITYWENEESISAFAGVDIKKAKYYREDDDFLLEKEETVEHYDVFEMI